MQVIVDLGETRRCASHCRLGRESEVCKSLWTWKRIGGVQVIVDLGENQVCKSLWTWERIRGVQVSVDT